MELGFQTSAKLQTCFTDGNNYLIKLISKFMIYLYNILLLKEYIIRKAILKIFLYLQFFLSYRINY